MAAGTKSKVTTDHEEIRRWAVERSGTPAAYESLQECQTTATLASTFVSLPIGARVRRTRLAGRTGSRSSMLPSSRSSTRNSRRAGRRAASTNSLVEKSWMSSKLRSVEKEEALRVEGRDVLPPPLESQLYPMLNRKGMLSPAPAHARSTKNLALSWRGCPL